ncbi:MAG: hypothetical protein Q9172_005434 [Xanthocarpia lactea]
MQNAFEDIEICSFPKKREAAFEESSLVSAPPPYDALTPSCVPPTSKWNGSCYHIWMAHAGSKKTPSLVKITTPDMTPLCTVRGFGAPSMRNNNAGDGHEEVLANISSNFDNLKCDPDIDIGVAADQVSPSGFIVNLKRDKGTFTRSHRMTLSDGKTYRLTGKHSNCLLMCWGNLKVVEEYSKTKVAKFKVEWLMSVHKVGVVTFTREVEETLLREILFAVVGVAGREYAEVAPK